MENVGPNEELADKLRIASTIRNLMEERKINRRTLAFKTGRSLKAIDLFFTGQFSLATLTRIEAALETKVASSSDQSVGAAPEIGGYSFRDVEFLQGSYLFVRPLFGDPSTLNAYRIDITWDNTKRCLQFTERDRKDSQYVQQGTVYSRQKTPFLSLLSIEGGDVRNILINTPIKDEAAQGLILTIYHRKGMQYIPVAAPCFLKKFSANKTPVFGFIKKGDPAHENYSEQLSRVRDDELGLVINYPPA